MEISKKLFVPEEKNGRRLDLFLSEETGMSRTKIQKIIRSGGMTINGEKIKKVGIPARANDVIEINEAPYEKKRQRRLAEREDPGLLEMVRIVSETPDYLVLIKPAGLLTHPTDAGETIAVTTWLLNRFPDIKNVGEDADRPGIVHRLDKEASGLLVIPKTQDMFRHLKQQFQERRIYKEYMVLAHGTIDANQDIIDFEIDRGKEGRMAARPKINGISLHTVGIMQEGKEAITEFRVVQRFSRYTLLAVTIHTGRTHQIRVHLFAYGHPVVGDALYANKKLIGKRDKKLHRLFLHAAKLCFYDYSRTQRCFEAALPEELTAFLGELK